MTVRFEAHVEPIPGYRLLSRLGSGGFGEVWKCEAPGGIFKAVKVIHGDLRSPDSDLVRYAEQELKSLKRVKQVRHPYLLALDRYDIVEGRLIIVMELADCNLWDRFQACRDRGLPGIPRDELLQYMAEVAEVLDLFNDQFQLQHLDIKPQNLFLLHNHVKVADFGQVKDLQGLMAQVTGGITPVYAAPETFDGVITRYCDQYSLACVYQELLTGIRPFDGSSMNQLLMQHLHMPPNLEPCPPGDRPALFRALAKEPDERWPTVTELVRALAAGGSGTALHTRFVAANAEMDTPSVAIKPDTNGTRHSDTKRSSPLPADDTPLRLEDSLLPIFTPAPREETGPGPLQPALIIGLGFTGLRILQRLRFDLNERYGPAGKTPSVRTLFIDTDAESLESASRGAYRKHFSALPAEQIYLALLNRAGHYLKPRFNGRSLIEGWFDQQLLYRLPRTPQTLGLRLLGRLAFLDHYRPLMAKIQAEIEAALVPEAMAATESRTGLQRKTNRPRVYLVGGLAGGTCGGMFLDAAYAIRNRLRRMGYDMPDVVGLFMLPPADATQTAPPLLANTYAALTELNHYSRSDTIFTAHYDERFGLVRDKEAPFTRCYLMPSAAIGPLPAQPANGSALPRGTPPPNGTARPGSTVSPGSRLLYLHTVQTPDQAATSSRDYFTDAAERLRLDLFSMTGVSVEAVRDSLLAEAAEEGKPYPERVTISAFGVAKYDWPRAEVVGRTALRITRKVLKRWTETDPKQIRETMAEIAAERWSQLGFLPDVMLGKLRLAADLAAGDQVDEVIGTITEPLVPRGWLSRLPEPVQFIVALDKLNTLFGPPISTSKRQSTPLEEAIILTAVKTRETCLQDLQTLLPTLVDDVELRVVGTEELYRQFLTRIDRIIEQLLESATELESRAQTGFECLTTYAHFHKGMRKPSASAITEALRQYPRARFQALTYRQVLAIYQPLREKLAAQLAEVSAVRQKVAGSLAAIPGQEPDRASRSSYRLMPPGCANLAEAVERFLSVLTIEDELAIERGVQSQLESAVGGLYQLCLKTGTNGEDILSVVFDEAKTYLDNRLGEVGLTAMFAERFRTPQQGERAIEQAYHEAEPALIGNGPWSAAEIAVVACPDGEPGQPIRELARRAIPVIRLTMANSRDDITIYREWPEIPLSALPHLGPASTAAYETLPEVSLSSPHARLDVTRWLDVDAR